MHIRRQEIQYQHCKNATKQIDLLMKETDRSSTGSIDTNKLLKLFQDFMPFEETKKRILWSGTYNEARLMANFKGGYITLERTLIGYMLDGWSVCIGLTPEQTPIWKFCPIFNKLWSTASKYFAETASGNVSALINASRNPILRTNSVFEVDELPMIRSTHVTKFTLHLLDAYLIQKEDPCELQELYNIKKILREKRIPFECMKNQQKIIRAACLIDERRPVCSNAAEYKYYSSFSIITALLLTTILR